MTALTIIATIYLIALISCCILIVTAPLGYECPERGFILGTPPEGDA